MPVSNTRPPLVIDMVSDPVCPWCYVGFRSLGWALMALSFDYDLTVRYRPYRLDPTTPPAGRDRASTLARKFPDPTHREQMKAALEAAMVDAGLNFSTDTPTRLPDTTDAHRLIRWSHETAQQRDMVGALFEAYWQHGEDLGQHDVLVAATLSLGLDGDEIRARLQSDEDRQEVQQEAQGFRDGGVDGVPTFIINEQTGFAGALPKAKLLEALRQLASEVPLVEEGA